MERDVIDIVKEKEFIELSAVERDELGELCSTEEEFNQMKAMFTNIGAINWSNPTPRSETKESLDHLFTQKHPKAAPIWYNAPLAVILPKNKPFYRQPLIQAAAVGLLIFLAYPLVKSNVMGDTAQVAVLDKEDAAHEVQEEKASLNDEVENLSEVELSNENEMPDNVLSNDASSAEYKELEVAATRDLTLPAPATSDDMGFTFSDASAGAVERTGFSSTVTVAESGTISRSSDHPDGVFIGLETEIFSAPASREPAVFDLLTSTF